MADKSEKYKRLYENWISKKAKQLISTMAAAQPPQILSEDEAREIVAKTMLDEWKKSAEYKKLQRDSETGEYATQTVTTTNRFTEMLTKKRAARVMEEKPGTTEEAAFAEAEKDVLKRETDDKKNVSKSTDPIAAKILTNIASILMDISEDVVALRESGSNALDQAEATREKGKGEEKEKNLGERGKSKFEIFLDGLILMLFPFFLGIASKFVDLTKGFGLLTGTVLAAAMAFGVYLAKEKLFSLAREKMFGRVPPSVSSPTPPTGPPSVPPSTTSPTPPTGPPSAGAPTTPGAPGAPGASNTRQVSSLTTLGKGIKDLGKGAGQAIKSILKGITDGFAYMGDNLTRVAKGALALGLIGAAFAPFALSLRLLENVKAGAVLAATLGIALVSASVIALGNAGNSIFKGVLALAALGVAFAPFALSLKLLENVKVGAVLAATLAIGVVSAAVIALGNAGNSIFKGVLALAALGGAMAIFGAALSTISGINGGELLKVGAALVGFGLLAAVLGGALANIALGSLAIALLGGALFIFGNALETISGINGGDLLKLGAGLLGFGLVAAGLGLMFPMIALGAAAMVILAGGLIVVGKALEIVAPSLESATESIKKLGESATESIKKFGEIEVSNLLKVGAALIGFGLVAAGLGLMFPMIALGAAAMVVLAGGLMVVGKALEVAAPSLESATESIKKLGEIDGSNLLKLGLAAAGLGLMFPMIALGAAAMTILAGGLMVVGKALEVAAPSLESATESIKKLNEIDGSNLLEVAKGITGIGLVAVGLGLMFPVIALGAAAMTILAGGLTVLGKALEIVAPSLESAAESIKKLNEIDGSNLLNLGAGLFSFGLAAAGLGLMFPMIALGAVAMVVLAGGATVLGKTLEIVAPSLESAAESIKKFGEIDGNNLLAVAKGIAGIGLAMVAFSASMLAASAMGVGSAILDFFTDSPLEKVLQFAEDAKDVDVDGAATAVSKLTKAIKQLDSISGANLFNIGAGLTAVSAGLVAFSASNVTAGLGNLVTKFLSFLSGGKTPVEQIIELSEKHRQIFEAGKGVESMGKGVDSFAGVDTEKLSRTIEIISNLSDSQLEKLARFQAVQSQPAATQQLGQAREGVNNAQGEKSAQSAPAVVNNVNQTAVNKSDTTYKSTRSGPAVKGDALLMGA